MKPGIGVAVKAILSDSDLKVYKTKSTCNANHRLIQGLVGCVFNMRYPHITEDAFAETCSKLGASPDGEEEGDLTSGCVKVAWQRRQTLIFLLSSNNSF